MYQRRRGSILTFYMTYIPLALLPHIASMAVKLICRLMWGGHSPKEGYQCPKSVGNQSLDRDFIETALAFIHPLPRGERESDIGLNYMSQAYFPAPGVVESFLLTVFGTQNGVS